MGYSLSILCRSAEEATKLTTWLEANVDSELFCCHIAGNDTSYGPDHPWITGIDYGPIPTHARIGIYELINRLCVWLEHPGYFYDQEFFEAKTHESWEAAYSNKAINILAHLELKSDCNKIWAEVTRLSNLWRENPPITEEETKQPSPIQPEHAHLLHALGKHGYHGLPCTESFTPQIIFDDCLVEDCGGAETYAAEINNITGLHAETIPTETPGLFKVVCRKQPD